MAHVPLTHAISACQRGWTNPVVVSILEGHCTDLQQREAQATTRLPVVGFQAMEKKHVFSQLDGQTLLDSPRHDTPPLLTHSRNGRLT
jgi:hypothetical protein